MKYSENLIYKHIRGSMIIQLIKEKAGGYSAVKLDWKLKCWQLSCVWLFVTPWTVARPALLSMGFSRQEYWSG